jgi:hypothetical protein
VAGGAENLIPFSERSKEEARECGRAGGIASGIARRRKRSLREAADLYLSLPVSDKRKWNKLAARYVDPEDIDNQMAVVVGMVDAAAAGDARAARVVVDLLGDDNNDADSSTVQVIIDTPLEEYSE